MRKTEIMYKVTNLYTEVSSCLSAEGFAMTYPPIFSIMDKNKLDIVQGSTHKFEKIQKELESCEECGAVALVHVNAKTSDRCWMKHLHREHEGDVLRGMGVGEDDYLDLTFCAWCGQIQGEWPKHIHGRIVTRNTEGYPYDN